MIMLIIIKNRAAAAAAMLALLGLTGLSAPASAQTRPNISTSSCKYYFRDIPANTLVAYDCAGIRVQMMRTVDVQCGPSNGTPPHCGAIVRDHMRARWIGLPGFNVYARNVFSVNPNTCRPTLSTSYSAWCSYPYQTQESAVQAVVVHSPIL